MKLLPEFPSTAKTLFSEKKKAVSAKGYCNFKVYY